MLFNIRKWESEKNYFAKVVSAMVGRHMYVQNAVNHSLGYTKGGNVIYIAQRHPLYEKLLTTEVSMFRFGVAIHEGLHQVFTNFDYFEQTKKRLIHSGYLKTQVELSVYATIVNLIEDPAIENMAYQVIGGVGLRALYFTIAKINELAEDIGNNKYPMEEVLNALIQFGDLGIIHGSFRWNTARKVFLEIAPLFYRAIYEPNNRMRIDMAVPIYEACLPLWNYYSENKKQRMQQNLNNVMSEHQKANAIETGKGSGNNGEFIDETRKQKKQLSSLEHLKDGDKNDNDSSKNSNEVKENQSGNADDNNDDSSKDFSCNDSLFESRNDDTCKDMDFQELQRLLDDEEEHFEEQQSEQHDYYSELPEYDIDISAPTQKNKKQITCLNWHVDKHGPDDAQRYDAIVEKMSDNIVALRDELNLIFQEDRIRKFYSDSGRISLNRIASGKKTTKLFRRKERPVERENMCIGVIGDRSASMKDKIEYESMTIIALAETFSEFDIPLYFLDFNYESEIIQQHYICWENTRYERERLLYMNCDGSNCDFYSIQYMTKLLMERPEKHKVLIAISDGLPSAIYSGKEGINQNTLAIDEAKAKGIGVVGIGIGRGASGPKFEKMYGKNCFFNIQHPKDLFNQFATTLTTVINSWT